MIKMIEFRVRISNDSSYGILFHNNRVVDPLDSFTRYFKTHPVNSKSSDEQYRENYMLQWYAGLYTNHQIEYDSEDGIMIENGTEIIIPQKMLQTAFRRGATQLNRLGKKFSAGCLVSGDSKLKHKHSSKSIRDLCGLCSQIDVVKIGMGSKIIRCRPHFVGWESEVTIKINESVINPKDVFDAIKLSGICCGIGDWRPEKSGVYGQFDVEEIA